MEAIVRQDVSRGTLSHLTHCMFNSEINLQRKKKKSFVSKYCSFEIHMDRRNGMRKSSMTEPCPLYTIRQMLMINAQSLYNNTPWDFT